MLEDRGVPSVAIGAVRVQMEKTRPPRGLFVPFQLGRPVGEPEDVGFQRRVLLQALGLLERTDGPVILEDFPDDPPGWTDASGWTPPALPQMATPTDPAGWRDAFAAERAALQPVWAQARARFGRNSGPCATSQIPRANGYTTPDATVQPASTAPNPCNCAATNSAIESITQIR